MNRRALRATWHAVAAGDPDRARAQRLLDVIDRGLEQAFALDQQQPPVKRGSVMQPPWWDEHSDDGWVVLGAVLGYPPASTYAALAEGSRFSPLATIATIATYNIDARTR